MNQTSGARAASWQGRKNSVFDNFAAYASLRAPSLWRVRFDLVVLFFLINAVVAFMMRGFVQAGFPSNYNDVDSNGEIMMWWGGILALLCAIAWSYWVTRSVRLRDIGRYRNRPGFTTITLIFIAFGLPWVIFALATFDGEYASTRCAFIIGGLCVAFFLAALTKAILMSRLIVAIGSLIAAAMMIMLVFLVAWFSSLSGTYLRPFHATTMFLVGAMVFAAPVVADLLSQRQRARTRLFGLAATWLMLIAAFLLVMQSNGDDYNWQSNIGAAFGFCLPFAFVAAICAELMYAALNRISHYPQST